MCRSMIAYISIFQSLDYSPILLKKCLNKYIAPFVQYVVLMMWSDHIAGMISLSRDFFVDGSFIFFRGDHYQEKLG